MITISQLRSLRDKYKTAEQFIAAHCNDIVIMKQRGLTYKDIGMLLNIDSNYLITNINRYGAINKIEDDVYIDIVKDKFIRKYNDDNKSMTASLLATKKLILELLSFGLDVHDIYKLVYSDDMHFLKFDKLFQRLIGACEFNYKQLEKKPTSNISRLIKDLRGFSMSEIVFAYTYISENYINKY